MTKHNKNQQLNRPDRGKDQMSAEFPDTEDMEMPENIDAASEDEEAVGIIDEENEDLIAGASNVAPEERELLREADEDMLTEDELNWQRTALDNTDDEGMPLNEKSSARDLMGTDLDVPGSDADDEEEAIGEEDEENNQYSLGGDRKD